MTDAPAKPAPRPTADSADFWRYCAEGSLMLRHCRACDATMFYPRILCTNCMSTDLDWRPASGRGTVHAVSVVYRAPGDAFRPDVPYVIALVELAEGPRLMSNIVDCPPDEVHIDMPVRLRFESRGPDIAIPQFAPDIEGSDL